MNSAEQKKIQALASSLKEQASQTHSDLIDHIRRVGVVFYEKQSAALTSGH